MAKSKQSARGAALVIVLFIVALATTIAAQMSINLMVQVQKSTNLDDFRQAKWYAYAAEALAQKVLRESIEKEPDKMHLQQPWALAADTPYPVENGTISGAIRDLQTCLNLNALRAEPSAAEGGFVKSNPAHKALLALLKEVEELPAQESEEAMADSVFDWLDEDSITMRSGAEEDEYLSRDVPYLTANNFFADISELRLVKGFNPLVMQKIAPYVCVIPDDELFSINVNTITEDQALLLAAMVNGLSESGAQAVIAARPDEGFDELNEFTTEVKKQGGQDVKADDERFVLKSEYFQLQTTATFVDFEFTMTSLLQADKNNVTILARKFGGVQ
ncbi:Putative type II secretion system protein K [Pseudoalteromonas sp. THAF3]|nr:MULTISPECIES: type II secretion system minor pseudopilin GspK [Pseudoalteromonas]MCG7544751.1 type II secretion system minor pseudopilin GspK [Pseudoalteromonas sp. MM17-2]MCG7567473.1 type II secretion system minor pseudopilin GspK [Pseudoalteromonas sp. CnMc7-15]MCG7570360.1 type II secretion system minor pseudopilin GspK [Pseudoalteromonas sp. CNC9-20]QFU06088.1 Putative type II secretion system protein K [Pseudoalteromonas sp. THAF3]GAP74381.1 general secretion pathway protein K [Pseudo